MFVLDTTLRDGEQTPGVSLKSEEKLELARALDALGVDSIEAGSAITSQGEQQAIKEIAAAGLNAEVSSYARIKKKDIDICIDCGVDCVFLVSPTSKLHIKHKLDITQEKLLEKTLDSLQYCKDHGLTVDLCCEDGSRTDIEFLKELLQKATEQKVDRFTVADTVGILTPEKIAELFSPLSEKARIPLGVHCHDDLGLATANTVEAVKNGATSVNVTINGLGERAGNAPLEEVVMALKLGYGIETNVKTNLIGETSDLTQKLMGISVPPNKAIVGENAFTHEAGIHVDGILKKPKTYEAIRPEMVGRKRRFMLGKHVGMKSLKKALDEMQLKPSEKEMKEIFKRVKYMADKGKKITSTDLEVTANNVMGWEVEDAITVEELVAVSGNSVTPTASVKLKVNGDETLASSVGTGPVDAAIQAIRNATTDIPFELVEYHVDSISGGTDALVQVVVKLRYKGRMITSSGAGSDIIRASVDALVAGINSIMRNSVDV